MNFIRNLRLRTKLLLILFILIVPLVFFVQDTLRRETRNRQELVNLRKKVYEADLVLQLIHSVQKERGLAIGVIIEKGELFANRFHQQSDLSDRLFYENRDFLEGNAKTGFYEAELADIRKQVIGLKITADAAEDFYRKLINSLIGAFDRLTTETTEFPEINQVVRAQFDMVKLKQRLGRVRARVMIALADGKLKESEMVQFTEEYAGYEIYLQEFRAHATPKLIEQMAAAVNSESVRFGLQALYRLRNYHGRELLIIESDEWYDHITEYIDRIRTAEKEASIELIRKADAELKQTTTSLIVYITITTVIILATILISLYVVRVIASNVNLLRRGADKIAKGDPDVFIEIKGNDEIADLARSFDLVIKNYQDIADSAERIGQGDYDADVNIRSDKDVLGNSLTRMKDNLRRFHSENKRRNWFQTGSLGLTEALSQSEESNLNTLSKNVLGFLAEFLGFQAGALYTLTESNSLEISSAYSIDTEKIIHKHIMPGETLTGIVFRDKKHLLLSDLPEDFYHIESGIGTVQPRNGLIYPLIYKDEVLAVIEMALIRQVKEEDIQFMDSVSEKIALAVSNSRSRQKLEELLNRSQQQAEELEAQQEELRQVNEELTENSRMLQASEEELKVQQEELQEKNRELEENTRQLTEQFLLVNRKNQEIEEARKLLEHKNRQLETTSRYKSEFLANMSHELRTPLNSILILTRLLSENKNRNLTEKQVEFAETIYRSGNDLLKLINEILDLAKVESGKTTIHPTEFNPAALDLEALFVPIAKEKGIEFSVHCGTSIPEKIYQDEDRLKQVLKNLLSNAFKFTDEGGKVSFEIYKDKPEATYRTPELTPGEVISFKISDTGIGVPSEKLDLIFEAFQQADASTSRKYGGTGLGLSISKELVTKMGGEIEVFSKEGEGSSFIVHLPERLPKDSINEPEPEQVKMPSVPSPASGINPVAVNEILIVEDDPDFGNALCLLAGDSEAPAKWIKNGNEAKHYLERNTPAAILLDIGLPGMSGNELLDYIRKNPRLSQVPHYVLSGTSREDLALTTSINFLKKPVSKDELNNLFVRLTDCRKSDLNQILLVDDDPDHNKAVTELLCSADLGCKSASNAEEALEMLKKEKFDAVILDLRLPGKDGFWLMEQIRKHKDLNNLPVIVLSGKEISEDEEVRIRKFSDIIICKNSAAFDRLRGEVNAFLQNIQTVKPEKQRHQILTSEHSLSGKKVLLVDDDIRNIYALSNVLEEEGMTVVTAGNGQEALDKLNGDKDIDIILMDIMMPVMNGYDAMKSIRSQPESRKLPVIALTAKAMPGDRARCIEAGASDYIPKPVNTQQLIPLMKVWLYP